MATVTGSKRNKVLVVDTVNTGQGANELYAMNQNVRTSDNVTFNNVTIAGSISGYATESYVGTQISNLVDSSPNALNTLNELAAALGDDASFSTTVTNSIATKLPLAGGTMTGHLVAPSFAGPVYGAVSGASDSTIWAISRGSYPTYGIFYDEGDPDKILYKWNGVTKFNINFETGALDTLSTVTAAGGVNTAGSGYQINGTTIIDSSRNITTTGTISSGVITATGGNSTNWNTAYGWGNHASAGYVTTNTTYSAGTGITLTGTTFSLTDTNSKLNLSGGTMTGKISMFQNNEIFGLSGTIANYPRLSFNSSEGTHAAKTQTLDGDLIGQIDFNPYTGTSYTGGGKVSFIATEAITSTQRGTEARIYSTKTGESSLSYHQFKDDELFIKNVGGTTHKYWHSGNLTTTNKSNYDTAYGWGNHASAGYFLASNYTNVFKSGSEIAGSQNLDTYRTTGYYSQDSNADATSGSNYPVLAAGILEVITGDQGNGLQTEQRYSQYNTNNKYARHYYNGNWTAWGKQWNSSSDGSGSGLDADLLDGQHGSYYYSSANPPPTYSKYLRADVSDVYNGRVLGFGTAGNGTNTSGAFLTIEGNTDASGEGTGRLFFREHNSSTAGADNYGMSLGYRGGSTSVTSALGNTWTGPASIGNGEWGMWGHDNNATGSLVMHGPRDGSYVDFSNAKIAGNQVWHAGNGGSGSGLDADLLDGQQGSYYYPASNPNGYTTNTGTVTEGGTTFNGAYPLTVRTSANVIYSHPNITFTGSSNTLAISGNPVWHTGNDGSGSGLDADLLDGQQPSALSVNYANYAGYLPPVYAGGVQNNPQTYFSHTVGLKVAMTGYPNVWSDTLWINGYSGTDVVNMCALHTIRNGQPRMWISSQSNRGTSYGTAYEFWSSYNDGSGSTLDADLLDGQHGSYYYSAANPPPLTADPTLTLTGDVTGSATFTNLGNATLTATVANNSHEHSQLYENSTITYGASYLQWTDLSGNGGTGANGGTPKNPTDNWYHHIITNHANGGGYYYDLSLPFHEDELFFRRVTSGVQGTSRKVWHTGNDGSGSGLDADLLDGQHGSYYYSAANPPPTYSKYLRSDAADTASGEILFDAGFKSDQVAVSGVQDFDNLARSGFYNLYNISTSSTSYPGFNYGTLLVQGSNKGGSTFVTQTAYERTGTQYKIRGMNDSGATWYPWQTIWTSDTDGSGSGLDADLLDGQHGSYYYSSANPPPLTADPTLTLTGDVTGSATFTNLGNATLTATVADDSHTHSQVFIPDTQWSAKSAELLP